MRYEFLTTPRRPFVLAVALAVVTGLTACNSAPPITSLAAVRQIWSDYLASKHGQFAAQAGTASPIWNAAEQAQWPMYDLAGLYIPDQSVPEIVSVRPIDATFDTAYQIVTRFWPTAGGPRDSSTKPVITTTVYARREGDRWMLANALPYLTSSWTRQTSGRITYFIAPALHFDATKANSAAAFVDSLATAFGVAAPERIDYYVTESVDQALEIIGVAVPERYGAAGGFSKPVNRQVFSGIPALGEDYRHELAHVVLLPVIHGYSTSLLASEGVPTWLGGTSGRDFKASVRHLASLLRDQSHVTLDVIIGSTSVPSEIRNAAGAVLAAMLHESGGTDAVREFLRTPGSPRDIRAALERLLRRSWSEVVAEWWRRVSFT